MASCARNNKPNYCRNACKMAVDLSTIKYIVDMQSEVSHFLETKKFDHVW